MIDVDILEEIKIDEKLKQEIEEPSKYRIIMLNDDKTPMEWVVEVLKTIFNHSQNTAEAIMLQIHNEQSAIVGIYTYEIAEQKIVETVNASRDRGFPLNVKIEKNE